MKKGTLLEKGNQKPLLPLSIPFLSVLYQNKALHNFPKRRQRLIVKRNIDPEYVLPNLDNSLF